jgi:sugar phosphate isomerase/epimerase
MEAKLSIWSSYFMELSPEEAVEEFIKNGIYCTELSDEHGFELLKRGDNYIETGKRFGEFAKARNFEISQGHLWLKVKICSSPDATDELCKWIDMYEAIGIKNMVLHCDNLVDKDLTKKEKQQKNIESLKIIAEHIKDRDIYICLENLRPHSPEETFLVDETADDLLYIIDAVGSNRFAICLDTGHLNLTTKNQREFILKAGSRLKALHIADNQGEIDQHMMPFGIGNVNFKEVIETLREVDYKGLFNLEIPGESYNMPFELKGEKLKYIKAAYNYLMK